VAAGGDDGGAACGRVGGWGGRLGRRRLLADGGPASVGGRRTIAVITTPATVTARAAAPMALIDSPATIAITAAIPPSVETIGHNRAHLADVPGVAEDEQAAGIAGVAEGEPGDRGRLQMDVTRRDQHGHEHDEPDRRHPGQGERRP